MGYGIPKLSGIIEVPYGPLGVIDKKVRFLSEVLYGSIAGSIFGPVVDLLSIPVLHNFRPNKRARIFVRQTASHSSAIAYHRSNSRLSNRYDDMDTTLSP